MAGYTAVDLSQLPFPFAVEELDYETILAEYVADFVARMQTVDPSFVAPLESDPALKLLEVTAYRELLMRQRVNEAIMAVLLAYALGADLDQIGARFNTPRLLIQAADPDAVPPTEDVYESDDDYRSRIQLAFEAFSCAGPAGAYKYFARRAHPDVLDVSAETETAGEVIITVLSRTGSGVPDSDVLDAVTAALSAENVRPLCDTVVVQAATIVSFTVAATLYIYPGPDPAVVLDAAQAELEKYVAASHRLRRNVTLSGIDGALHRPGVHKVVRTLPSAEVDVDYDEASWCTSITLTPAVADE